MKLFTFCTALTATFFLTGFDILSFDKKDKPQADLCMGMKFPAQTNLEVFMANPQHYTFLCTSSSKGEVLSASLSTNNELVIHYASFWDDGDHSGVVKGFYDLNENRFDGQYRTNDGRFSGEINFSFNEKGEADGTWDNGYGIIKIHLKK